MHDTKYFQLLIEDELNKIQFNNSPAELYEPIRYMLSLGGKRLRPALMLLSCEMFEGNYTKAISPSLGIEVFHNFTLLHDDIMDKAPLRRAQSTVHKKWNADIAILSGDAMFVKSCQLISEADEKYLRKILSLFYKTAIEVCEGQQLDMNFENMQQVTISDYLHMIELNTAVLLACSLKIGAVLSGAKESDAENIYDFGKNIGIAFQLHDDILDAYGDEQKFGKQTGGDIIANKKTFMLLKAMELATGITADSLNKLLSSNQTEPSEKVSAVKEIYFSLGVKEMAEKEMDKYFSKAMSSLGAIKVADERKVVLKSFSEKLMVREA